MIHALKIAFQIALVGLGLLSMVVMGANDFTRSADREACQKQPRMEFVEHDYWNWDCVPERVHK